MNSFDSHEQREAIRTTVTARDDDLATDLRLICAVPFLALKTAGHPTIHPYARTLLHSPRPSFCVYVEEANCPHKPALKETP